MNKTKLLAGLAIGLAFVVTGCNQKPRPSNGFWERHHAALMANMPRAGAAAANYSGGETVAASGIDRALSRAEIYSRYSKETADEFYSTGLDH